MLYPFAPHISEELWQHLGEKTTITHQSLPKVDQKYLIEDTITYVIQVNGKLRARLDLPKDVNEEDIVKLAKENSQVQRHLTGEIIKTIFVPKKLINIVIKKS